MYSVYQHWDKLKTCVVGKSYPPEFYSYITNSRVRNVMERIAIETEEDYQKLINLLESFSVNVLRPTLQKSIEYYKTKDNLIIPPPMTPRDYSAMVGDTLYWLKQKNFIDYKDIIQSVKKHNKVNHELQVSASNTTRIGKDLYFGTSVNETVDDLLYKKDFFPDYRCHFIDTIGHSDACFCPVVPGLIISLDDIQVYEKTFPNWEVIYLGEQNWDKIKPFIQLKEKNAGKWWVPGEELNDDFTEFVETWLSHWVGYVEESVFDVNMLVVDKKNVICNNYNKEIFSAFERYGITPHIINFRHRYFWDGGLHCITSDLDREGVMEDYFPERNM